MDDSQGNKAHPALYWRNADIRIDKAEPTGDHISQQVTALLVAACTRRQQEHLPQRKADRRSQDITQFFNAELEALKQ